MSSFTLIGVGRIPLRSRDGSVRAYATVDVADFKAISEYRWHLNSGGYAARMQRVGPRKQRSVLMARQIMGLEYGDRREVDHIDYAAKLDNRRSNLRVVTHAQNGQNMPSKGGTSRFRGVYFDRRAKARPWIACYRTGGKTTRVGAFAKEEEAAAAISAYRRAHIPFAVERDAA